MKSIPIPIAFTLGLVAASALAESPFRTGAPVPALSLPSLDDGAPLSLSDFRGEKLMLHVWASW